MLDGTLQSYRSAHHRKDENAVDSRIDGHSSAVQCAVHRRHRQANSVDRYERDLLHVHADESTALEDTLRCHDRPLYPPSGDSRASNKESSSENGPRQSDLNAVSLTCHYEEPGKSY